MKPVALPLSSLEKADEATADRARPRRARSADEVDRLLEAARERPAAEALTIRTGRDRGQLGAKVRPAVLERERRKGVARRMAYLVAIWTGLRRSELGQPQWRDVRLDAAAPHLQLRAETTRSRRADVLPLHAQLVEELATFRPADPDPTASVLSDVPDMTVLKRDLARAGIDRGSRETGLADLHAMRMTLNNPLAADGVAPRSRQAQLRHADPKRTGVTHFDRSRYLQPYAEQLNQASAIPVPDQRS